MWRFGVPRPARLATGAALLLLFIGLGLGIVPLASGPIPDWRTDPSEPFPFTTPVPRQIATVLDGRYDRPPTENYPDRPGCTRCQPFPLDGGRSVLTLDRGRYVLSQRQPPYIDRGHYVVTANHITFFNSPECGSVRGVYGWRIGDGELELTAVLDLCGFGQRARDLTDEDWSRLP